jgi:hypothetical protein
VFSEAVCYSFLCTTDCCNGTIDFSIGFDTNYITRFRVWSCTPRLESLTTTPVARKFPVSKWLKDEYTRGITKDSHGGYEGHD